MVRKLPLVLAIAATFSPFAVSALGLGEIHTYSALNQRFSADIELVSVAKGELDDLKVALGSVEAFAQAGVERPFLLAKLRFEPVRRPDGSAVIRVSSRQPVREPFLDFLVEVNWPKGHLVREYTVLLDPPVTINRAPAPVQAPKLGRSAAPAARTTARSAGAGSTAGWSAEPVAEYGPTKKNDTLWEIAKRVKTDRASVEQMMMALWRENRSAFYNDNVNNLKVGQILRVPGDEAVRSITRSQARRDFLAQVAEWRERRRSGKPAPSLPVPAAPVEAVPVAPPPSAVQPPAVEAAAVEPVASELTATTTPTSQLKLATAPAASAGETAGPEGESETLSNLKNKLLLAQELNESRRQEGEEFRSRIGELEQQLRDVQRLLKLTNSQLAQMQAAVQAERVGLPAAPLGPPATATAVTEPQAPPAAAPPMEGETAAVDLAGDQGEAGSEEPEAEGAGEEISILDEGEVEEAAPQAAVTPASPPSAPLEEPAASAPTPQPVSSPTQPVGLVDHLMANATYLGVGAFAVLLLGLGGLLIWRRRAAEAQFQESILTVENEESDTQTKELFDSLGPESERTEDISFMSDLSPSSISLAPEETGEVDPLSEADVYIAYGRYQQAEELIREAIKRYPERTDLKRKLLEILFASKDVGAFAAVATELEGVGYREQDPKGWQEVAAMGRELLPEDPRFADASAPKSAGPVGPGSASGAAIAAMQQDSAGGLDFDLGLDVESAEEALRELEEPDGGEADLDLDLDELTELKNALKEGEQSEAEEPKVEGMDALDTQFGMEVPAEDETARAETLSLDELDLGEIDLGEEDLSIDLGDNLAELDIDSGPAEVLPEFEEPAGEPGLAGLESDEVGTKLDLARAYVDMGDTDGARSILDEVLLEGNEVQKQEANDLLGQLS